MKKQLLFLLLLIGAVQTVRAQEAYAVLSNDGQTVTFYYDTQKASRTGVLEINQSEIAWDQSSAYGTATTAEIDASFANYRPTSTAYWFLYCTNLTSITGMENLNTTNVTNMNCMFNNCVALTSLDLSKFNTSNVTNMSGMFGGCSALTSLNVSKFNTTNVTDMSSMFRLCSALSSLDVSNFNTANVKDMSGMFSYCTSLTSLDLSNFNTANVTTMESMFAVCSALTSLDVSNFNTANVEDMSDMFSYCSALTSLDLSNFNTDNVTLLVSMFAGCKSLTSLDLSNFNTTKVRNMKSMFYNCNALTSLNVSSFNTAKVTDMSGMFYGCRALTSLNVCNFNTAKVTTMNFMFFQCSVLTTLDLNNFNTANVTDMSSMFAYCNSLTSIDLSNFNTAKVRKMDHMFHKCIALSTIYCNDVWEANSSKEMFAGCENLKGGDGTSDYNFNNTSVAYAHPNMGGYFTKKVMDALSKVEIGKPELGNYWRSFYTETRNVKADENTKVYKATLSGDKIMLTEIADKIVPVGQAVVLRSTVEAPVLYTAVSDGTGDYSDNALKGSQRDMVASELSGTIYTLADGSEGFGFYKFVGTMLQAGKAYLVVEGVSSVRSFSIIVDKTTGIQQYADSKQPGTTVYDLQGRRVVNAGKGIYIENGIKRIKY